MITPRPPAVDLSTNGWKVFHRALANDGRRARRAATVHQGHAEAKKVFVIDDQSDYGKGLADPVKTARALVAATDKTAGPSRRTSPRSSAR